MDLPSFDTRPTNPLFGPLSLFLLGENPFEPDDLPETMEDLAERLGVTKAKLVQVRNSKGFRDFHANHTSNLTEIVARRREIIDRLYERGLAGSETAMNMFLNHTKAAEELAAKGAKGASAELSIEDAKDLTDEELAAFIESETS